MAINLLIDTSILLKLLNILEHDWNIARLNAWIKYEEVTLLVPQILKQEWEKNKSEKFSKIAESVSKVVKQQKVNKGLTFSDVAPEQVALAQTRVKQQIEIIDGWLRGFASFSEDHIALAAREKQRAQKLPPFQGGKASEKDALIIFSTLSKLSSEDNKQLFFISDNHTDFCLAEDGNYQVHPDIIQRFPEVRIEYFKTIGQFIQYATDNGHLSRRPLIVSDQSRVLNNFVIDPNQHPVLQLHSYLIARFQTIPFLPRSLFTKHFPLALNEGLDLYDYPFSVSTNNNSLYTFLLNLKIVDGKPSNISIEGIETIDAYEQKIIEILKIFTFNLVHRINLNYRTPNDMALVEIDLSHTLTNRYRQLQFAQLWDDIVPAPGEPLASLMEKSYVNYKLGNYIAAARLYHRVRATAEQENNYDVSYFSSFSLSKLARIMGLRIFDSTAHLDLQSEIQSIDMHLVLKYCTTDQNKDILSWISDNRFINEGIASLSVTAEEMAKLEHERTGGWNEHFGEILNTYYEVENFLQYNHIAFDQFSEFSNFTDMFLKGLFASYASNQRIQRQIECFPEWLLETLMLNATPDRIKYYISRYSIQFIEYKIDKYDFFEVVLLPFLSDFMTIRSSANHLDTDTIRNFQDQLNQLLSNAVVLMAITSLPTDIQERLFLVLQSVLENIADKFYAPLLDHLTYLFYKKNRDLSPGIARKFLLTFIESKIYARESTFTILTKILKRSTETLSLTENQFESFENNWLVPEHGQLHHSDIILSIADVLRDANQRSRVATKLSNMLDTHFDWSLFYQADHSKLIKATDARLNQFEKYLEERLFPPPPTSAIRRPALMYPYALSVDQYIHFCIEHKHPIKPNLLPAILAIDPYYNWLLEPETFNYADFQPRWLHHSLTKALKPILQTCDSLKKHLTDHLKQHQNNDTMRAFFEMFHT
jgi:hypothetical protein